jgi:polygalacturonase
MIACITEYGALGNGRTICTEAFRKAIEVCSLSGGGMVYVTAGTYLTGPIHFKSNINLHLEAGAEIRFSQNIQDYPLVYTRWEGVECTVYSPQIYGDGLENVSITGQGVLNGQGADWWKLVWSNGLEYPRPRLINFTKCKKIVLDGIQLVNSPSWTVHPLLSENITINNITIVNPADSPNTDGINPESCKNVHISNCHVDVGDDCVTLKAGVEDCIDKVPCENITITNCTMVHGHGGVVIGSEMSGCVRNVVISNCIFEGTDRGIRIKSRRGRGGIVEDVRVDNIIMKQVLCPFVIHLFYFCGPRGKVKYVWDKDTYPVDAATPVFRRIHFSNITARDVRACAGFLYGLPEMPAEEITFSNITVEMAEEATPAMPAMMDGIEPMSGRGFFCCNVRDIKFSHVKVQGHKGRDFEIVNGKHIDIF